MRGRTAWALALLGSLFSASCSSEDRPCAVEYGGCVENGDCASGATCEARAWVYGSGLTCERACESELDCPSQNGWAGRCLSINRDGVYRCYVECGSCPDGWVCHPIDSNGDLSAVCLP